jgi:pyruvate,water dikinase
MNADLATALEPGSDDWPALDERPASRFDRWTLANVGESWPLPVSPIVASAVPSIIGGALRHTLRGLDLKLDEVQWAKRWYGRVYFNEGALTHALADGLGLPAGWFDRSRGHRSGERSQYQRFRWLPVVRRLPKLVRFAVRQYKSATRMQSLSVEIDQLVARFRTRGAFDGSDRDLLAEMEAWFDYTRRSMSLDNDISGHAFAQFALLERMVGRWTGEPHLAHDVMSGLAEIQTAEIGSELASLARALRDAGLAEVVLDRPPAAALALVRRDPRGAVFMQTLERFLEQHGHRCPNDAEWLNPRWAEAPEEVLDLAASYLRSAVAVDPKAASGEQQQRRRQTTTSVEARLNLLQRQVFRVLLARTQGAVRLRDNGKNSVIKACYPARRHLHLLGQRWAARAWLSEANDVFFLTLPELRALIEAGDPERAGLDLRTLVEQRERARAYWLHQPTHDVLGPDGRPLLDAAAVANHSDLLLGIAASTGRVSGRARVVRSPRDAMRLGPGDILVTQATDTGWSAVFPLIGGLVTEIGGQLSHAAILAREYGLPTVVNVTGATSRIRDRDLITIDGGMGWVRLDVRTNEGEGLRV